MKTNHLSDTMPSASAAVDSQAATVDLTGVVQSIMETNDVPADAEPEVHVPNTASEVQNREENQTIHDKPLCRFYKQGRCKFGISGRKEGLCPFSHPKSCKKFLENGTRGPRGCNKGNQCEYLHPLMCYRSIKEKICLKSDCKYLHIKGTRRSVISEPNSTALPKLMQVQTSRSPLHPANDDKITIPGSLETCFLEHLQLMRNEILLMNKRLEKLDTNFSNLDHQQFPQSLYPTHQMKNPMLYQQALQSKITPNFNQPIPHQCYQNLPPMCQTQSATTTRPATLTVPTLQNYH